MLGLLYAKSKKALRIIETDAITKAKLARTAKLFSRTNTVLSIPMLFATVSVQNI